MGCNAHSKARCIYIYIHSVYNIYIVYRAYYFEQINFSTGTRVCYLEKINNLHIIKIKTYSRLKKRYCTLAVRVLLLINYNMHVASLYIILIYSYRFLFTRQRQRIVCSRDSTIIIIN